MSETYACWSCGTATIFCNGRCCAGCDHGPRAESDRETTPCMSRHLDNVGKPRPPVEWAITYGCANEHAVTTEVCDRCATSLTDGHQRCAKCVLPMVVTDLTRLA